MNKPQDYLEIERLKIKTNIGVHAWEQQIKQTLLLDILLPIQLGRHPIPLTQTIDYALLCNQITAEVASRSFELIEHVAEHVAELILTRFSVEQVQITVSKPLAVSNAGNISIKLNRTRKV